MKDEIAEVLAKLCKNDPIMITGKTHDSEGCDPTAW